MSLWTFKNENDSSVDLHVCWVTWVCLAPYSLWFAPRMTMEIKRVLNLINCTSWKFVTEQAGHLRNPQEKRKTSIQFGDWLFSWSCSHPLWSARIPSGFDSLSHCYLTEIIVSQRWDSLWAHTHGKEVYVCFSCSLVKKKMCQTN